MSQTAVSKTISSRSSALPLRLGIGLRTTLLLALLGLVAALFLANLALGSVRIPLDQVVTVLAGGEPDRASWANIILKVRLPRAMTALLAGGALGVAGLLMQTFFRNPLADPFVLGISSGASLGVALIVLAGGASGAVFFAGLGLAGDVSLVLAASLGAGLAMFGVLAVARRLQSPMTLLILGLMLGYVTSALVSLLVHFSTPERVQAYVNWGFGSFSGVTWSQIPVLATALTLGVLLAFAQSKTLNALLLGEAYARSMGVNIERARLTIILASGLLAGAVTAFCGPIGFMGIAVPHVARSLFRSSDHRLLLPASLCLGGSLAMLAALVAEVPGSTMVLPLNAITALFGAPVVIAVILRQKILSQSFGGRG